MHYACSEIMLGIAKSVRLFSNFHIRSNRMCNINRIVGIPVIERAGHITNIYYGYRDG